MASARRSLFPEGTGAEQLRRQSNLKCFFLFILLPLIGNKKFLFGFVSRVIQFCGIFKRMEISSGAIGSCSKDQKTKYQEWFHYADSGHYNLFLPLFSSPSLFLLLSMMMMMMMIIIIFFFLKMVMVELLVMMLPNSFHCLNYLARISRRFVHLFLDFLFLFFFFNKNLMVKKIYLLIFIFIFERYGPLQIQSDRDILA